VQPPLSTVDWAAATAVEEIARRWSLDPEVLAASALTVEAVS